jgi:hypothetical protein
VDVCRFDLCRFGLFLPFSCRSEKSPINLKDAKEKYTSHRRFLPFGDRLTQQYTLTPPLEKKNFSAPHLRRPSTLRIFSHCAAVCVNKQIYILCPSEILTDAVAAINISSDALRGLSGYIFLEESMCMQINIRGESLRWTSEILRGTPERTLKYCRFHNDVSSGTFVRKIFDKLAVLGARFYGETRRKIVIIRRKGSPGSAAFV